MINFNPRDMRDIPKAGKLQFHFGTGNVFQGIWDQEKLDSHELIDE